MTSMLKTYQHKRKQSRRIKERKGRKQMTIGKYLLEQIKDKAERCGEQQPISYPYKRGLDKTFFRIKRDDTWHSVCFSDLNEEEQMEVMEKYDIEEIKRLAMILAKRLYELGESYNLVTNWGDKMNDKVNSPKHYIGEKGLEVEEVLRQFLPRYEDAYVAHRIGSAMEYLLRSPLKNGKEDLRKAIKNIELAIEYLEEGDSE